MGFGEGRVGGGGDEEGIWRWEWGWRGLECFWCEQEREKRGKKTTFPFAFLSICVITIVFVELDYKEHPYGRKKYCMMLKFGELWLLQLEKPL